MLQNIIDWLEDFGIWGLAIHSFFDAIIFPIPAFFLQVSLSMVNPSSALLLATVGYIACLLGTPFGYWIGKTIGSVLMEKLLKKNWIDGANAMFRKNGETAILIGSFTPIPFKVFTILSGSLNYPLWKLMAYASVGRAVKFYAVGVLFHMYGRAAEGMVKDVSTYIALGAVSIIVVFLFVRKQLKKKKSLELEKEKGKSSQASTDRSS